jgi:excisionase family DNA binding protein
VEAVPERLDIAQAAERLGLSQMAVRKRIQRGQLPAEKVDGRLYVVLGARDGWDKAAEGGGETELDKVSDSAETVPSQVVHELMGQLDKLHRENLELAGRLGFYQAKLQEAEAKIALLEAPRPDPKHAPQHPWWQFWRPR